MASSSPPPPSAGINGSLHPSNNGQQRVVIVHHGSTGDLGNNKVSTATEGWLELFVTPSEKQNFAQWREVVQNKSLVNATTRSVFEYLSQYLPDTLAPNVLTLTGCIMLGQAWYLVQNYGDAHPAAGTWLAAGTIALFFCINSTVPYHADRIRQQSALSDLFKYACDSGSVVWLALLTTYCLGGENTETQWYAVQACQLVLFLKHLSAFERQAGLRYRSLQGPGEVLLACIALLLVRAVFGLDGLVSLLGRAQNLITRALPKTLFQNHMPENATASFSTPTGDEFVRYTYYALFTTALVSSATRLSKGQHGWTRFGLVSSLLMRLVPAVLLQVNAIDFPLTVMDVVCDGLFLAVLTSDLVLAKMARRELHPWVVMMSLAATLSYGFILTLVVVYYIAVFSDLCSYLNLPLLATCRNVYCDGVYDLCHIGHKLAFQNALAFGNRLFVGVVGDADASQYKRPPIMTHSERCAEVEGCKAVTKVIPNAPCFGLTQEFLDEHQIHVVAFGEEYLQRYPNPKDDPYYGYVRQLGIARPLPRTDRLSTTDLIKRIQASGANGDKKSPT